MNIEPQKMQKIRKRFFKLRNNAVFGKTMQYVRAHRDIKHKTTEARRKYLVSEPNCHKTKTFSKDSSETEMKSTQILVNKQSI